ncbi:MAG: bifunctional glutamate N-acetyltransferase/amino-acid acetyltransferase ArgJ [Clostridia bacterium]|nr:bifunctional glutamate N-acetyltransferase/amino-acid acetyltransferase ArgJ [Clostridia bacterium]
MTVLPPFGFRFVGLHAGVKRSRPDLGLVLCERPATVAGVFTTNVVQAPPVVLTREVAGRGRAQALAVVSGNANAATGPSGWEDTRAIQEVVGEAAGVRPEEVAVACTGVIGVPLPMERVRNGLRRGVAALVQGDGSGQGAALGPAAFAEAIRTTDTFAKIASREVALSTGKARILGVAKGSGMIHPQMATMLAFAFTDAAVAAPALRAAWRPICERTFNQVTVDGDTSTNDMALVFASGAAGGPTLGEDAPEVDLATFSDALSALAAELAAMIARDGEGATRLLRVVVTGAESDEKARAVARVVAGSALVKAAVHGADPNWGRVLAAAGRAGVPFDPASVSLWLGPHRVLAAGCPVAFDEGAAKEALAQDEVDIRLSLGSGPGEGVAWGCDLSAEYVRINADYRS